MTTISNSLDRFLEAQEPVYSQVISELQNQKKESHWIWFIFPQIRGLGRSEIANYYAICDLQEAIDYLDHSILGTRLIECCELIYKINGKDMQEVLGYPDDLKLKSCLTLFSLLRNDILIFGQILEKFYGGNLDKLTVEIVTQFKFKC